jgi:hypothetical protein
MSLQPSIWLAIAAAAAAWVAAIISFFNVRTARRALRIAQAQEARRKPLLELYLVDGDLRFLHEERARTYAFLLSISNPTDTSNSVAEFGLRINYATKEGVRSSIIVPFDPRVATEADPGGTPLQPPVKVESHQTVAGWLGFRVAYDLIANGEIEDYVIVATDTHGLKALRETVLVREVIDVEETAGEMR